MSGPGGLCSKIVDYCHTEAGLTSKCGLLVTSESV